MNALVKKEVRLLLPSFSVASALAMSNAFMPHHVVGFKFLWYVLPFVSCPLVALMMALGSFGAEVSAGTFSLLLAQPVARRRMWNIKALLLVLAFLVVGGIWSLGLMVSAAGRETPSEIARNLGTAGLSAMLILSGALWSVLLLRQVAAAFWFTLLTPGLIAILLLTVIGDWPEPYLTWTLETALVLYSVGGFLFARRLFLRAQDVQWSGGNIALPQLSGLAFPKLGSGVRRQWRPRAALQSKELQLHQSQFIMAGVLAVLHLCVLALRTWGNFRKNSTMEYVAENFWTLWLVMPLLVGCAAAAEERRLGTLQHQLCLPVRRRTQFRIKLGTVLVLSVFFGAVMPALLELPRLLAPIRALLQTGPFEYESWQYMTGGQIYCAYGWHTIQELAALLAFPGLAAGIGLIAFYASTYSRSTLESVGWAVADLVVVFASASAGEQMNHRFLGIHLVWEDPLIYLIAAPVLVVMLLILSSWNWRQIGLGWRAAFVNAGAWAGTLIFIALATTATYQRAWERLTPFEPAHGRPRLNLLSPSAVSYQADRLTVRLPDGRVWSGDYWAAKTSPFPGMAPSGFQLKSIDTAQFIDGSNWVNIVNDWLGDVAGIKKDGTLWVSAKAALPGAAERPASANELVQYGTDTDWRSLAAHETADLLLTKQDGTLWQWGPLQRDFEGKSWPGLRTFTPVRLGTESDWAEVSDLPLGVLWLCKTNGTVWTTRYFGFGPEDRRLGLSSWLGFSIWRAPAILERSGRRSLVSLAIGPSLIFAVLSDGKFHSLGSKELVQNPKHSNEYQVLSVPMTDMPIGSDTNWEAAAGTGQRIVTLRNDGSLWVWSFPWLDWQPRGIIRNGALDPETGEPPIPVRLGTHSDWIAIASADGGIISLAADGSLWYWLLDSASDLKVQPLLELSRKPQYLGNIFESQMSSSITR